MADWEVDSARLHENLQRILVRIRDEANARVLFSLDSIKVWHHQVMHGLESPSPAFVGNFRGEPGLEGIEVSIGSMRGVRSDLVRKELTAFEKKLLQLLGELDTSIPSGKDLIDDEIRAALYVCAWAHAEWVRIHPFANGNGRIARLLSNSIAMRYGLPPFVRLRPRPGGCYGGVAKQAMRGNHEPTYECFKTMLVEFLAERSS